MIEIGMLRCFIAVAELRSFTRASELLNASQPVISRSIKRLEELVGAPLVERTTRSVRLTPAGASYYPEARGLVERLAVATENARRIASGERAVLRVGVCPATVAPRIAWGVQAFRELWPAVEIQLSPTYSIHQPRALRAAELDVGVMLPEPGQLAGLERRVVARDPLMVAVPSVWRLNRSRIDLSELSARPWIMPDPDLAPRLYERLMAVAAAAGFEPKVAGLIREPSAGALMLACGVGAAFTPGRTSPRLYEGSELIALDGLAEPFDFETALVWAPGATSIQVQDFVRCVLESAPGAANPLTFA